LGAAHGPAKPWPVPAVCYRLADDAADQAAFISGWEQDYAQISCGRFPGGWMSCAWDACRCSANIRPAKPTSNASPGGCHLVWHSGTGSGERLRFHGRSVPPSAVLVAMGGSDFTLRTPDDFTIYGIVLEQEVLALRHQQLFGRDLPAHWLQRRPCACPKPATGCCVARFPSCWRWRGKHRTALAANYCWIVRWMPCCWP
jgi:AraC family ethanolamine operon transcriptional activator